MWVNRLLIVFTFVSKVFSILFAFLPCSVQSLKFSLLCSFFLSRFSPFFLLFTLRLYITEEKKQIRIEHVLNDCIASKIQWVEWRKQDNAAVLVKLEILLDVLKLRISVNNVCVYPNKTTTRINRRFMLMDSIFQFNFANSPNVNQFLLMLPISVSSAKKNSTFSLIFSGFFSTLFKSVL